MGTWALCQGHCPYCSHSQSPECNSPTELRVEVIQVKGCYYNHNKRLTQESPNYAPCQPRFIGLPHKRVQLPNKCKQCWACQLDYLCPQLEGYLASFIRTFIELVEWFNTVIKNQAFPIISACLARSPYELSHVLKMGAVLHASQPSTSIQEGREEAGAKTFPFPFSLLR